jgi:hypothetical protein
MTTGRVLLQRETKPKLWLCFLKKNFSPNCASVNAEVDYIFETETEEANKQVCYLVMQS